MAHFQPRPIPATLADTVRMRDFGSDQYEIARLVEYAYTEGYTTGHTMGYTEGWTASDRKNAEVHTPARPCEINDAEAAP